MISYPTPTFDAKTIGAAPGYRPTGKSGMTIGTIQPEAETALSKPNKKTKNGAYFNLGVRSDDIPKKYSYLNGTPLSKPNAQGNQLDTMLILQPQWAEPKNPMMVDILDILNAKVISEERMGNLTQGQIRALAARKRKLGKAGKQPPETPLTDFAETQRQMTKERLIRNAMAEGFTRAEAEKAYGKVKEDEAVKALKKERQPSEQLREILDSRYGTGEEGRAGVGNPAIDDGSVSGITPARTIPSLMSSVRTGAREPRTTFQEEVAVTRMAQAGLSQMARDFLERRAGGGAGGGAGRR